MESKNGAFRKKKLYFSQVSNRALRDNGLSLKAKGLYALIQSYITIENFTLYKATLIKQCAEGKKAFESAWNELKDKGYLLQYKLKSPNGHFYYEYELLDESIHTPKKEVLDKGGTGERGIYNNTGLNNKDLNNTDNTYIILSDDADTFIPIYKNLFKEHTGKEHMRIKRSQLPYILDCLSELREYGVTEEEFAKVVNEHFMNLPKSNNGNILAFLKAMMRYFEVHNPYDEYGKYGTAK